MQLLESFHKLNEDIPYALLWNECILFDVTSNFRSEIAVISILHHDTVYISFNVPQRLSPFLQKCMLVSDYVWMLYRCQNADLIQRVFFLFHRETHHLYTLQGVNLAVLYSTNFIDSGICTISKFNKYFKVLYRHIFEGITNYYTLKKMISKVNFMLLGKHSL